MCLLFQLVCHGKTAPAFLISDGFDSTSSDCQNLKRFKFCHFPGTGKNKNKVIYFFHGVFVGKHNWEENNATRKIQNRWTKHALGTPTVISISYGPVWLLTSSNTKTLSGLLDEWTRETFYEIEKKLHLNVRSRIVFGDSMGGHNALKLVNKLRNFFDKAGLICPAITVSPLESNGRDVFKLFPNFTGQFHLYFAAVKLMSAYYDDLSWQRESPFNLESSFYEMSTKLRFQLLSNDIFGFTDTSLLWIREAQTKGAHIDYQISRGFHCDPENFDDMADFLYFD